MNQIPFGFVNDNPKYSFEYNNPVVISLEESFIVV